MKQNLIADYLSCILFRVASFFTFCLPLNFSLFLGRRLGDLIYLFDRKHRAVAYANIKKTVASDLDCSSSARITRRAYQAFGQNLVEISFIPRINKQYLEKYIHIENKDYVAQAFNRGKGVIFLIVHEGNWELSNIICANFGIPFVLFVRDQGFPRLNALLNAYRLKQGAKIIHKQAGLRQLIEVLKDNQSIGMTVDQGGKNGQQVRFFGRQASMSVGAVKLALKHGCSIIPVFYTRIKGAHVKVILDQVFVATASVNAETDLKNNLQRLMDIYEKYLRQYPYEYLWTYKIYKYGREREVLILTDTKTGHLRQSEAAAKLVSQQLAARGIKTQLLIQEVKFRRPLSGFILSWVSKFSAKSQGEGNGLRYLRYALTSESWQGLMHSKPDVVISAGGALSAVNYLLARENQAKSVVLMRPAILSLKKFDLAIIPRHDTPQGNGSASNSRSHTPQGNGLASNSRSHMPQQKSNVVITEGALNLIDADYLSQKTKSLGQSGLLKGPLIHPCIGVLIGGDSKRFSLGGQLILDLSREIKKSAEDLDMDILISTSRRSSVEVEEAVKGEFTNYARCKLLVIARQNNNPDVVGAILGSSSLIVCSPESISMISEAASAEKYVVVINSGNLSAKHQRFLKNYQSLGFIYLKQIQDLSSGINQLLQDKLLKNYPKDNLKVIEGINKIL